MSCTEALLADYLRTHPVKDLRLRGPEFLTHDGDAWFLRWPNGSTGWYSAAWLTEHSFSVPMRGLLDGASHAA